MLWKVLYAKIPIDLKEIDMAAYNFIFLIIYFIEFMPHWY